MTNVTSSCPHCFATNRLPAERLNQQPNCGKCKQPLYTGQPMVLSDSSAQQVINNTQTPILIDCWAPWCGPCKSFAPVFTQATQQFEPKLRLAKLDTEANPMMAQQWQIRSIPTLLLFSQGREINRLSGELPLPQLQQWISQQGVL